MRTRTWLGLAALLACFAPAGCGKSDGYVVRVDHVAPSDDTVRGPLGNQLDVTARAPVDGLDAPVDIVRDSFGIVHIYARTPGDAFRVEGWMMAHDRAPQLELLRRTAEGRMAETFGRASPSFVDQDIAIRSIGLIQSAAASYDALDPNGEPRALLDAFADGVSQYFARLRGGDEPLPESLTGLSRDDFAPWSGVDSLAIAGLYSAAVALPTVQELAIEQLIDGAAAAFPQSSTVPSLSRRSRSLPDLLRFAPPDPATVVHSVLSSASGAHHVAPVAEPRFRSLQDLTPAASALSAALTRVGQFGSAGSNAWAVAPSRSASGHAMLASDPHLQLTSPAAPWLVHLEVTASDSAAEPRDIHVAGAAMAGTPGIAHGFNQRLAWGAAASYFDVADLYRETLAADGSGVRFMGSDVAFGRRTETIEIKGESPLVFEVLSVPHHGPVLPRIKDHAVVPPDASSDVVSVRWTGATPGTDFEASIALLRAQDIDDARAAAGLVETSGLSYVFADADGRIMYSAHARLPRRDPRTLAWDAGTASGLLPCRVLPGDGTAEWTGLLDDSALPLSADPPEGFVATANADPLGGTLDNDPSNDRTQDGAPAYLGCTFAPGFRLGRIQRMLQAPGELHSLDDMSVMQADVRSPLGARIAPKLIDALRRALEESQHPGTYPHLSELASSSRFESASVADVVQLLEDWGALAAYNATPGVKLADAQPSIDEIDSVGSRAALLFNTWLVRFSQRALADEASSIGLSPNLPESFLVRAILHLLDTDPALLASYDPELRDSILWDDLGTPALETRDELMVASLLDAVAWLDVQLGTNRDEWRWGRLHTVRLSPPVDQLGGFAIPKPNDAVFPDGFPRPGDLFAVNAAPYDLEPASLDDAGFHVTQGAALRLTVDMAPSGPSARAVIAGGQVADPASSNSHFADDADYWRHDLTHELPFKLGEVLSAAESRVVASRP